VERYRGGRASYFEVLEAQQQLFPAEDALAQTQRDQLLAVVNLYRALGGGWRLTDAQWTQPTRGEALKPTPATASEASTPTMQPHAVPPP